MKEKLKIAVLGGGGRTGKYVVTQLLQQGYHLNLLLRKPENIRIENPEINIILGNALDPEALHRLLNGCQAVISTIGQRPGEPLVASQSTIQVLAAMARYGINRYIAVAGLNVDTPYDNKGPETSQATEWMKSNYPEIHADRQKAYTILSESNINWTLVRVPFIQFTEAEGSLEVDVADCPGNKINAGAIASFLVEQLTDTTYFRKSPFIANG